MSLLRPFQEIRFRKAFQDWMAGRTESGLSKLRALEEEDPGAARFLPLALAEGGRAREGIEKAEKLRPFPPAFRAILSLWAREPEEGIRLLGEKAHPNPLERAVLGLAFLEAGKEEEAVPAWSPSGPGPWRIAAPRSMAVLLERHHNRRPEELQKRLVADLRGEEPRRPPLPARLLQKVFAFLEGALPAIKGDKFEKTRVRVRSLASRGEWDQAVGEARRLRREFKERPEATELLVQVLAQAGQDRALLEVGGEGPGRAALEGIALAALGRWEEAFPRFEKALEEDPADLISAYGAACSLALRGKRDEAARAFLRVLALEETAFDEVLEREARIFLEEKGTS